MYEALLYRDLIEPMQDLALHQPNPVTRSAGLKLADVAALLHRLSPLLHELQIYQLRTARPGETELLPGTEFTRYVDLCKQYSAMLKIFPQGSP